MRRGDLVWADFGAARGSEPAKVRPAVIVQDDWLLDSEIRTVLVVPVTSNTALGGFPGNVLLPVEATGLAKDSVALVTQIAPLGREFIEPFPVGRIPTLLLKEIGAGLRLVLGV